MLTRRKMKKEKAFKIMEWICFIGFSIVAGWFASGVLEQFFSHKTSFSQHEGVFTKYPVISLVFVDYQASEVKWSKSGNLFNKAT